MQCGQETDILMLRIRAKMAGSVSMAVFTLCEVVGHRYITAAIHSLSHDTLCRTLVESLYENGA